MKLLRILIGGISLSLILSACEKEKIPLSGERKVILTDSDQLQADPTLAKATIHLSKPVVNTTWDQAGFDATHVIPHLQLPENLAEAWRVNIGVGSSDEQRLIANLIAHEDRVYAADTASHVTCLEAQTGNTLWSQSIASGVEVDVMIGGLGFNEETLFITTGLGEVIALDGEGKEKWRRNVPSPIRSAPTIKDGRVFVLTVTNELFAFDTKTGNILWNHAGTPETTGLLGGSSPAIQGNTLIAAYSSGEVYAYNLKTGEVLWSYSMMPSVKTEYLASIPHIRARPLVTETHVYLVSHGQCMVALDLKTGTQVWKQEIGSIRTPALAGDYLFVIESHGNLVCVDRHHGKIAWVSPLPQATESKSHIAWSGPLIAGDHLILYGTNGEILFCSPQTGQKIKSILADFPLSLSPIVLKGALLALADNGDVMAWR